MAKISEENKKMKIIPIAFDSLGTRSMCTKVITKDVKIMIDPAAALGPRRYGLPPHKKEIERLNKHIKKIISESKECEIIIITHYHYDHHLPNHPEIFKGKIALVKHPKKKINKSQYERASYFLKQIKGIAEEIEYADGREFKFGKTKIKFSPPFWHGPKGTSLGYVIMCCIDDGKKKMIFGSDVQGPSVKETADWIIEQNPDILIIDGVATIFIGWRMGKSVLEKGNEQLIRILENTKVKKIILDHHIVRDINYLNKIESILRKARELGKEILTAAEFLGKKNDFLEARRKELWGKNF